MDCRRMLAAAEGSPFVLLDGYHALDHHEESWSLEKLPAEEFFVDDLLDLGGIASDLEDQLEGEEEEEEIASTTSALSGQSPAVEEEEPIVPEGDIFDLEWVSRIVDDSVPVVGPFVLPKPPLQQQQKLQLVPNPTVHGRAPSSLSVVSVSSPAVSACRSAPKRTLARFSPEALPVPCRARTKRSRRVWSLSRPDLVDPLCSSSSSSCSSSCSSTSSCLVYEPHAMSPEVLPLDYDAPRSRGRPPLHRKLSGEPRKKTTRKPEVEEGGRRCSHCGVQKTPQWRTGPMGAKTLCNACGVRYKSGRLLPEYRPACSPTFLSHVHSNSHRKVLEMRREKEVLRLSSAAPPFPAPVVF